MARHPKGTPPPYLLHRATGQAYSTYAGRRHYFGRHGTAESRRRYREFIRRWEAAQLARETPVQIERGCTVAELVDRWQHFAEQRYRLDDGTPTAEVAASRRVGLLVAERYGALAADDFRARHLRALREEWIGKQLAVNTVNRYLGLVRRCWRWGVSHDLVDPGVLAALEAVPDCRRGRGDARDTAPVRPVEWERVEAVLPLLTERVAAMVRVQWLVGCRPGEVCRLRGRELDREGVARLAGRTVQLPPGVWVWQPGRHKARHRGKALVYLVGPQAQAVLTPWLRDDPDAYLFQPRESMLSRQKTAGRAGGHYTPNSYANIIALACRATGVPPWRPNRLRHACATRYDHAAGLEVASTVLGHSDPQTTLIYRESDLRRAAEFVARLG